MGGFPLNGKLFCQKKLSGIGGPPPPPLKGKVRLTGSLIVFRSFKPPSFEMVGCTPSTILRWFLVAFLVGTKTTDTVLISSYVQLEPLRSTFVCTTLAACSTTTNTMAQTTMVQRYYKQKNRCIPTRTGLYQDALVSSTSSST